MENEGKKMAVLLGCNYPGTDSELHGCYNDVIWMGELLIERFGFSPDNIVLMVDTPDSDSTTMPTGANIIATLFRMIRMAEPGDVLFFHFSGHGTLIPSADGLRQDEAIVPGDFNLITDVDFRMLVNQLPRGASFTFLSDSCHSGGLIDKEQEQIGPHSTPISTPPPPVTDDQSTPQSDSATKSRSLKPEHLPHDVLVEYMKNFTNKDESHVRDHLTAHFGTKASSKFHMSPAELELYERLHPDMGVLLSGCQADELSTDVRLPEVAFGALSNAVRLVLGDHPAPLSNRELAVMVRKTLEEEGFTHQHPCLYCSDDNAAAAFLGQPA